MARRSAALRARALSQRRAARRGDRDAPRGDLKRLAALLLAAGCGGGRPESAANPPSDSLVLERRIASDEAGDHPLGYIGGVLASGDRLLLIQPRERHILVHDTAGRFIREVGRDGAAPGEFRSIIWAGLVGDTLWASDPAQDRVSAFDTAGALLATRTVDPRLPGWPRRSVVRAVVSGGLAVEGDWSYDALASGAVPALVPVGITSRSADAPRVLDRLDRSGEAFALLDGSGAGVIGRQPFGDSPVLVPDGFGRGFAILHREVADTGPTLRVTALAATGETLFTRALTPRRVPLTDQVFDSAANDQLARAPRRDASVFRRPRFRPVSGQAFFARDGALWVNLARAALRDEQEWAVLDADGSCRARLAFRPSGRVEAADGWRIWVVEPDSLDVPSVVRYRVVPRVPADTGC